MNSKPTISIIGYGRFGKVLASQLASDFFIKIFDLHSSDKLPNSASFTTNLAEAAQSQTIFIAVPIRAFQKTIQALAPLLKPKSVVIDVCSVKEYPVQIMLKYLPESVDIIATHPLYGPDSLKQAEKLKIMFFSVRDQYQSAIFWKNYFLEKNFNVLEMTPEEHDRLAAKTQGITHFIGRLLKAIDAKSSEIDTQGFKALLQVMTQTCNDPPELFADLQTYNPHSKEVLEKLIETATTLKNRLFS